MKSERNTDLRIILYVFFLFITNDGYIYASDITPVKAYFKNSSAKMGRIVTCYLDFKLPEGFNLPEDLEIKGIEGFDVTEKRVVHKGIEIDLFVDRFDELKLPPLIVVCYDQEGKKKELAGNSLLLKVESTITETPSPDILRPIKEIISTKYTTHTYMAIALAIAASVAIVILCYFFYKRKQNREYIASFDIVSPHIKALDDIDALVTKGLPDSKRIKAFYFKLSEILREYVENIRDFNALEMTTDEIAGVVKEDEDRKLLQLLKRIDLIKFAGFYVIRSEVEEHVLFSREYINKTKPESDSKGCEVV